jgi:NAD(P)-dependent dehydrogenase (short-subunit alcohol dehydrogenase family)
MKPEDFNIIGLECDVSSERSVQKAYQQIMDTFGRIDSVVASAGTAADPPIRLHLDSQCLLLGIVENYSAFE